MPCVTLFWVTKRVTQFRISGMAKHIAKRRSLRRPGVKILRRGDGSHVARWRDPMSGKSVQQNLDKLGLSNDALRQQWAAAKAKSLGEMRAAVAAGTVDVSPIGVAEAVDRFFEQVPMARNTKLTRRVPLRVFAEWCGKNAIRTLADLKPIHMARWRGVVVAPGKAGEDLKPSTKNLRLVATATFLRWARSLGYVPLVDEEAIRAGAKPMPAPVGEVEFLRPQQVRQLLQAAIRRDAASRVGAPKIAPFVLALLLSGCRRGEIESLTWDRVELEGSGLIRLAAGATKTQRARVVGLDVSPSLLALLRAMRLQAGNQLSGRVFACAGDCPKDSLPTLARRWGAPHFSAHTLRRTCGTVLTNAVGIYGGASAFLSAKRLGHSVVIAERLYVGVMPDLPREARTIEAALGIEQEAQAIVAQVAGGPVQDLLAAPTDPVVAGMLRPAAEG